MAVGGRAQFIYLPATLAVELGFAHDEGLNVTLQDFEGGSKSLESLLGGSSDVVCGFYDHTIQMAAQGRALTAFLVMLQYPGLVAVAVAPEVARIEDLKGRTAGVSSAGSSTHMFLNYLLTTHGLAPGDVTTANIGMAATAVAAVTRGQVALAIMTDPALGAILRQVPAARILADTRTSAGVAEAFGTPTYPSAVLYTKSEWLERNPDRAAALARALRRAVAWIRERSAEEVWQRLPPEFRTEREADLAGLRALQGMLSPDGRMQPEAAQAVRRVLAASLESVRSADIDLSKTYTNRFVEQ
jgi:NitT/TauT family transport system substrate-binding protein